MNPHLHNSSLTVMPPYGVHGLVPLFLTGDFNTTFGCLDVNCCRNASAPKGRGNRSDGLVTLYYLICNDSNDRGAKILLVSRVGKSQAVLDRAGLRRLLLPASDVRDLLG